MAKMPSKTRNLEFFESRIADFFEKAGREHLPWRRDGISAYEVWVSEIMLQQTQVSRVLSYYERFLNRFPNVESLAMASWEEFLPYYSGLGYYARGRNMLRAASAVVERFGGEFPRDVDVLRTLPGIGRYTASAIASFAYGAEEIAWDTNVRRVIGRFFFGTRNFQKAQGSELSVEKDILENLSVSAKTLNAALMDFGSAICSGKPKCAACPLSSRCAFFRDGGSGEASSDRIGARRTGKAADWKNAFAEVVLHENHRKYFSSRKNAYRPFRVPASHNTRAGIKAWFLERFGLDVAVRPPHDRILLDGAPVILVNAQILSGVPAFAEFSRASFEEWHKEWENGRPVL